MSRRQTADSCITLCRDSRVKIAGEHRRTAVFINGSRDTFRVVRVDGCLIKSGPAADWIVSKPNFGDLVIELKGRDVGHALTQVVATLQHWSHHPERLNQSGLAALIVCAAQKPQVSAQKQRVERQIRRDFGAKLSVLSGNREFEFDDLFR